MDNKVSNIEICKQCQHKDCRYCRFNPSNDTGKSNQDMAHDNELRTVEIAIRILRRKVDEFLDKASCKSCPLKGECWNSTIGCRTMFLNNVLSGVIDADGNLIKKCQPQD